jgi:hypothetical protein
MNAIQEINLSGTNNDIAQWIWDNLIPKSGQADSLQGEILRAIERLRWEAQENGNINWDEGFEMLIDFLQSTLGNEESFSKETRTQIHSDLQRLKNFIYPDRLENKSQVSQLPYVDDDLYDRLTEILIQFCRQYPQVIQRNRNPKQYR